MIRLFNVHYPIRGLILPTGEGFVAITSFVIAIWIRFGAQSQVVLSQQQTFAKIVSLSFVGLACSYFCDPHTAEQDGSQRESYCRIFTSVGALALLLAAITHMFPVLLVGSGVLPMGLIILTAGLMGWRRIYYWLVCQPFFRERVYVLGGGERTQTVLQSLSDSGVEVVNCQDAAGPALTREELADRIRGLRYQKIHKVIVAVSDRRGTVPIDELLTLRFSGIKVEYATALFEKQSGKIEIDGLSPSSLIFSDGFRLSKVYNSIRVVTSALMSLMLLVLVLPLIPFIVLAIKLTSPGPIIYRQARVGINGTVFHCYKFRTMCADAEADIGPTWAGDDDPRITRVGRFLRRTRMDEIPQLWNVLCGDMLFVGPRPERPEFVEWLSREIPYYQFRHVVRPGLTGWAQVRYKYGNSINDAKEKLKYDLFYIKNISFGLDALIFLQTIKVVLARGGK
jgi:sugar transferase (PEP-CTERM system associated)